MSLPWSANSLPGAAHRKARGIALLLVVGMLFVMAVMAAHLVAVSEVAADEAHIAATRSRLRYTAESAADRAFWLLVADRRQYASRALGLGPTARPDAAAESWMTDGVPHEIVLDDFRAVVEVADADAGLNVADPSGASLDTLKTLDADWNEALSRFKDLYIDYADANDSRRLSGGEREDYAAAGWPDLPRNSGLRCREEFFWLPGAGEILARFAAAVAADAAGAASATGAAPAAPKNSEAPPEPISLDRLRIIPPANINFPATANPSFFSSSPPILQKRAALTPEELATVLEARQRWTETQLPLADSLDVPLMQRLRRVFSFRESGVAVIQVTALSENNDVRLLFRCARDLRTLRTWNQGTPTLVVWEELSF